ncbi:hypothetical protein F511_05046 [Dorcoceras hygrometricum]|uniref:Kinesin motor domain-containing protein n=1 Tax=Dorcoceras hygrometricum TaxID=472368 RepID=A0A2Z7AV41_9LAMI|nr:hypothetical protein F511_05046 [Dorcoceras hygrometricum]
MSSAAAGRSSISPFRSRKSHPPPVASSKHSSHPTTLSSTSSSVNTFSKQLAHAPPTKAKENVTVTVRFRPLSAREISKGDEVAWFADGDYTVSNEFNSDISLGFDRVFSPATTTRHVYDVAAQHVVNGAMNGINGTVFAYGVTSSGKTHTMHGEQKSPGVIPLAVKDVFGFIQETPGREFLLRVSYLEIYNEVINDLLDSTGQNLRIREDSQGTYVEGIKEEVVLSPAHALSLIASGEGSESSKTETTGLRRKEGSYINKSLLTLGTVISKLTDGKSTHIPYRDSKLTRLLQSSLSGHGRVSLICTVTPASSNSEETYNTLKFAQRSKHVEIKASQNMILDEKSLIKKYQREISNLKQELQNLKSGMMEKQNLMVPSQEDLVNLKLQVRSPDKILGQVKLQSRLEEEEQAKAALMGRIQRLTKLILVSTKNTVQPNIHESPIHRRRHSFGEDELAYLPDRKRDYPIGDDAESIGSDFYSDGKTDVTNLDELVRDYRSNRRRGMLSWFKLRKPEQVSSSVVNESPVCDSPASSSKTSQNRVRFSDMKDLQRKSISREKREDASPANPFPERTQAGELFCADVGGRRLPPTGSTITDQMDLFREQIKMLYGEVALSTSSLKRLTEQASKNPEDMQLKEKMQKLKIEIREKKIQMRALEHRMIGSEEISSCSSSSVDMSQALSRLATQLNEKTFELEIKSADNRVLQEQLQGKILENAEMQETITLLRQQIDSLQSNKATRSADCTWMNCSEESLEMMSGRAETNSCGETSLDENTPTSVVSISRTFSHEDANEYNGSTISKTRLLEQAAEIESLKQDKIKLIGEKDGLEILCNKQGEEASYAKDLAAAAAVELRNLAEEVTNLSYLNAKLVADLAVAKDVRCKANCCQKSALIDMRQSRIIGGRSDACMRKPEDILSMEEFELELNARYQREASLVAALSERDKIEADLRKTLDDAKKHEAKLENELANMWVMVAKMHKTPACYKDNSTIGHVTSGVPEIKVMNGLISLEGQPLTKFYENEESVQKIS